MKTLNLINIEAIGFAGGLFFLSKNIFKNLENRC